MDDLHGCGSNTAVTVLMTELGKEIRCKEWFAHGPGEQYEHLKRIRRVHEVFVEFEGNPKHLRAVLQLTGFEGRKRAPTPIVQTKEPHEAAEELDVMMA